MMYLTICFVGIPFIAAYNIISSIFRGMGDSKSPMSDSNDTHKNDDIINLPHHMSSKRPRMAMIDRAAQFSPFAALTGYDAAVKETARLTEDRIALGCIARQSIIAGKPTGTWQRMVMYKGQSQ